MKNFDCNPYHPHNAYSNHSYSSSNNAFHPYQQQLHQQLQQQPQQPLLHHQPTYTNFQQRHLQHQLLQHNQQEQTVTPLPPTPQLTTTTSNTSSSILNANSFNMQATTYANLLANYNHNFQNNNSSNVVSNYNNNSINQQHVGTQQQHLSGQQREGVGSSAAAADKFTMDACEIANFLANELFMQQLVSADGIQSGVPTLTTSTLTPTTLRSIEETFIQLTSEPINAPYQAGFIPPPLAPFPSVTTSPIVPATTITYNGSIHDYNDTLDTDSEDSQTSWNGAHLNEENSLATTDTSSAATDSTSFQNGLNGMGNNSLATSTTSSTNDFTSVNVVFAAAAAAAAAKNGNIISASTHNNKNTSSSATPTTTRRNQGGRRPAKSSNMSPEEEEKRRIRRERNKLAAARCRKRRVDQTNELLDEVAALEKKREGLQKHIENLNGTKQELEYILEAHRPTCQKVREDLLSVSTFGGLIAPTSNTGVTPNAITGMDPTLATTSRSISPIDLKPNILPDNMLDVVQHIKNEPIDSALDSGSSLDHDGPPSPKRILLTRNNPMIPPPLPNVATLSASLAAASASLNTPIVTTAPVSFSNFSNSNATLNTLNAIHRPPNGSKQRPNSLPTAPRNLGLQVVGKPPTDINGVAIQTPSTGMFNFDSLMDGGTGLTPVSGPLVPTCSSQNKHPLELTTPTSEPSKLVSL